MISSYVLCNYETVPLFYVYNCYKFILNGRSFILAQISDLLHYSVTALMLKILTNIFGILKKPNKLRVIMSFTQRFFVIQNFIFRITVHNLLSNYLKVLFCPNTRTTATKIVRIILVRLQVKLCSIENRELIMPVIYLNLGVITHV